MTENNDVMVDTLVLYNAPVPTVVAYALTMLVSVMLEIGDEILKQKFAPVPA